jgi:hypothetical protein
MKKLILIIVFITAFGSAFSQSCIGTAGKVKWSYWDNFKSKPDTSALFALENYPDLPSGSQDLFSLATPVNFTNYYGALIRGYIKVPQTATYVFNVTGDDQVLFYLSSNENPNNKRLRAEVPQYTDIDDHTKYPSQTSITIQLVANQYYYFELINLEGSGGDDATLFWKKNTETTWTIVNFDNIYGYNCGVTCPPRGQACNDGNPLTVNDVQDGFCNCVGETPSTNACVGVRGKVEAYYYDNIPGSYIETDLTNAPNFPLVPDRRELLKGAYGPLEPYTRDNYGTLVQGYLTVPVTGNYEFNITGDNQTYFFLSKNDEIIYKQNHQLVVINGTAEYDHKLSILQSSSPIYLEKGKYYYYEFRHKENTWRDHFNLFWKTPFYTHKDWKLVPSHYMFDYKCEVSCIALNTPCNDNNPFTNNDKINANCDCVGTPCSGPDCNDTAAKYQPYDDCKPTDNFLPLEEATWVSCSPTPNPNTARTGNSHWIKYSFSAVYKFGASRVWNYNVTGQTNKGFNQVAVDYSMDGVNWLPLGGNYTWPKAPALADYAGFVGPNFNDLKAKYILITSLSNHGDASCSGFSKITFDAKICNPKGTPCDDGDPLTSYDKFDDNCNCRGVDIHCGTDTLKLERISLATETFKAKKRIETTSTIPNTQNISFTAGNSIVLLPGFEVKTSGVFEAKIADCIQQQFMAIENEANARKAASSSQTESMIEDVPTDNLKRIIFRLNKPGEVSLKLNDEKGQTLTTLIDLKYQENLGTQIKNLPVNRLKKGKYFIVLKIDQNEVSESFVIK